MLALKSWRWRFKSVLGHHTFKHLQSAQNSISIRFNQNIWSVETRLSNEIDPRNVL